MYPIGRVLTARIAITLGLALAPVPCAAQQYYGTRSVHGIVVDATGAPVKGAVVKIEDLGTLQIRSFLSRAGGQYSFHGLSTERDYKLSAEFDRQESDTKTLTRFDSRRDAVVNLKLPSGAS